MPYLILQVASRALRIPASKIHISETGTNLVPNTSPTAASASSDIYGMAVMVSQNTFGQDNVMIEGSHMFFYALTFAGSGGCCLNTRPTGRVFNIILGTR